MADSMKFLTNSSFEFQTANEQILNIIERVSEAVYTLDHEWRFTYLNATAENILGIKREETLGKVIWDVFPKAVGSEIDRQYHWAVFQQISVGFETILPTLDISAEIRAFPSSQGLAVFLTDITEKKRTEQSLRQSRDTFRAILDVAPAGVIVVDSSGHILLSSREIERIYGSGIPEDAHGSQNGNILYNLDGSPIPDDELPLALALSGQTVSENELFVKRADGSRAIILADATPLWNDDQRIYGAVMVLKDITERISVLERIQKSEERKTFLLKLCDTLRFLTDPIAIQARATRMLGEYLEADRVYYGDIHEDEGVTFIRNDYFGAGFTSLTGEYSHADFIETPAALLNDKPLVISDTTGRSLLNEKTHAACDTFGIRAFAAIPLIKDGKLVGTLNVIFNAVREWTEDEVAFIQEVGERTWEVVKRAQAEEALRESRVQLEIELADSKLLQGISAELLHENNIQTLYERIIDAAARIMRSECATIQILHPESNGGSGKLHMLAFRGLNPQAMKCWEWVGIDTAHSACSVSLRTGRRTIVPDVEKWEFMKGTQDLAWFLENEIHAYQTTPLLTRSGNLIGMIATQWRNPHRPSERDLRLCDILARQAADLIERKQVEETLRESEERLRLATETANMYSWAFDVTSRTFKWPRNAGNVPDFPLAKTVDDFLAMVHHDDHERLKKTLEQAIEKCNEFALEFRLVNQVVGREMWIFGTGFVVGGVNDKPVRIVGIWQDITERKRAEEATLASEREMLKVTLDSLGEGVVAIDQEARIIFINETAANLIGCSRDKAIGQYSERIFYVFDDKTSEPIDLSLPRTYESNLMMLAGDLCEVPISLNCSPIKSQEGQIIGAVAVFQDISERLKTQRELAKTDKLESLGILAGGIAHDFNNILGAILSNIQLAIMKMEQNEDIRKYLDTTVETTYRASELTKQLLTFSKGGAPVRKDASLNDLIKDTVEFVLRGAKVRAEFAIPGNLWSASIDESQISQVIHNLIINAQQAMPKGGVIFIRAENITAGRESRFKPGNYVKIAVADQGVGIPKENLGKIFDPFFTTKQQGNGLGLATSYSIIHHHEGYLEVESQVGVGTAFFIYLPAVNAVVAVDKTRKEVAVSGMGYKILLMDDEKAILDAVGEMLRQYGYQISLVSDGESAIDVYREATASGMPFDAVILDLTVPGGKGGQEVVACLRDFNPGIKAIIASGYANDPIIADYERFGFVGMVSKPYKIDELNEVLQKVLSHEQLHLELRY